MTEKLLKAALNSTHKHTHFFLFLSFRRLAILKFARIPFYTVPHKSHNAINIDFSIAFWYLDVLSGILAAFRYFGAFRSLYAPLQRSITGAAPPTLTWKEEERITEMFQEVERSYRKYINRYILFSFSYV